MTDHNETPLGTAFTVSIEAREGVSTGISAADRAQTIQVAIDPQSVPHDLVQPGHVFPLARAARRSAAARRSDGGGGRSRPACGAQSRRRRVRDHERRRDDGPRPRPRDVLRAARDPKMVTVADLIEYRRRREKLVERVGLRPAPDRVRRVRGRRVPRDPRRQAARRARQGRGRGRGERPRPRPLRVPDRRRLPLAPLRLRRAARAGARPASRRGSRCRSST